MDALNILFFDPSPLVTMLLSKYWWRGKGGSWEAPWGLAPKDGKFEVITMAEPFSIERRKLMRFMGAKVGRSDVETVPRSLGHSV